MTTIQRNEVEQYFDIIEWLVDQGHVREGVHYKITTDDGSGMKKLWLRPRPIHHLYMSAAQRMGMNAMTLGTVIQYLVKHDSFIHYEIDGVLFLHVGITSAHVFNYDILEQRCINITHTDEPETSTSWKTLLKINYFLIVFFLIIVASAFTPVEYVHWFHIFFAMVGFVAFYIYTKIFHK